MSTYRSNRAVAAAQARIEREAVRTQKELTRRLKEQTKLDLLAAAQLEVAASENRFEVLLSLHKDCAPEVNWFARASALRPPYPIVLAQAARREWRLKRVSSPLAFDPAEPPPPIESLAHSEHTAFEELVRAWEKNKHLAESVLRGDEQAFMAALAEFSLLDEIAQLGATIDLTVHSVRQVTIDLRCNDVSAIPASVKSLTASGKVSEKQLTRARLHEIYQDHVCSSLLRVAREAFAVLPVDQLVVNGHAMVHDSSKGTDCVQPVYSVFISREGFSSLNFDRLDPSDAIESFPHRGDFKGARKMGAFQAIEPLGQGDTQTLTRNVDSISLSTLRRQVTTLRDTYMDMVAGDDSDSTHP
jgi:hypothetical protein